MEFQRNAKILDKKYKEYLFPTILSTMSVLLASFIDGIIVANLDCADSFTAVNLSFPIILIMQVIYYMIGIGATVRISQEIGRHNTKEANSIFSVAIVAALIVSIVFMAVGCIFSTGISEVLATGYDNLAALTDDYIFINFLGAPVTVFIMVISYIIRADGNPKLSARILLISNICNLTFDLIFIGIFKWGIKGAAAATVSGYVVGLIIVIIGYFGSDKRRLQFHMPSFSEMAILKPIIGGSIASTTNTALLAFKSFALNSLVIRLGGDVSMHILSVCNTTLTFISMFTTGSADAMTTIVGGLYGEHDNSSLKLVFRRGLKTVVICSGICVGIIVAFPGLIQSFFGVDEEALFQGNIALRLYGTSLLIMSISYTLLTYYQATAKKKIAVMISLLRGLIITIPVAYALGEIFGIYGVWAAYPTAELLTLFVTLIVVACLKNRNKDKYSTLLLLDVYSSEVVLCDTSVRSGENESVGFSKYVYDSCINNGESESTANLASVLGEEIIENIKKDNDNAQLWIDILCKRIEDDILFSIRYNGNTFDGTTVDSDAEGFTNLKMIKSIASDVNYTVNMGLNSLIITLKRR